MARRFFFWYSLIQANAADWVHCIRVIQLHLRRIASFSWKILEVCLETLRPFQGSPRKIRKAPGNSRNHGVRLPVASLWPASPCPQQCRMARYGQIVILTVKYSESSAQADIWGHHFNIFQHISTMCCQCYLRKMENVNTARSANTFFAQLVVQSTMRASKAGTLLQIPMFHISLSLQDSPHKYIHIQYTCSKMFK